MSMLLSIVIPIYNEVEAFPDLLPTLWPGLEGIGAEVEVVLVDDGSRDGTATLLAEAAAADPRVVVLSFTRNFGHQAAITAGIDHARGDAVVVMDADLQDPPEILPEMVALYRRGYDVVSARRVGRDGESPFKRATAAAFYWVMQRAVDPRLVPQVGDFRLFSRGAVEAIRGFREEHRFMRGLVAWLGLREVILPFHRRARVAGSTKYPLHKMVRFAWTAISSFSALPLKLCTGLGLAVTAGGLLYAMYVVYEALVLRTTVRGWSSLVCFQAVFSGTTLVAIGLVGDYVARIYEECKGRPLYVVGETRNLAAMPVPPRSVSLAPRADQPATIR